jgi:hypothetical protein
VNPLRVDVHPSVVLLCLVTKLLLKMSSPMLAHTLWLSGNGIGTMQALVHPPKGERPPNLASCLSVEGLSPRWAESVDKGSTLARGGLSTVMVIMVTMHVLVGEFLG